MTFDAAWSEAAEAIDPDDGDVLKAIEILGNRQEYARIVTEQDTPRK